MHIKIVSSEKGSNKGSAAKAAFYLEKENEGKALGDREWFFSHEKDKVGLREVVESLDKNQKNLGKKDAKFFMLVIAPSKEELTYIGEDKQKLRVYTREVMDRYAENFGKGLKGEDLLYFAKIEKERSYKGTDLAVQEGRAKQGELKEGNQTHIHVLVSRKCRQNKLKLSPLSKHRGTSKGPVRGGFDRKAFYEAAEKTFDARFGYERKLEESFAYQNTLKNHGPKERLMMKLRVASENREVDMPLGKGLAKTLRKSQRALTKDQGEAHREIHPKQEF